MPKTRIPLGRSSTSALPYDKLIAKRLEENFKAGDILAAYECCGWWRFRELPHETTPSWVVEHLVEVAGVYFDTNETRPPGRLTSYELVAKIELGKRGSPSAWIKRSRSTSREIFNLSFDAIVEEARTNPTELEYLAKPNMFEFDNKNLIEVLNSRGEPTAEFQNALAEAFNFGSGWGNDRVRTARRRRAEGKKYAPDKN